MWAKLKRRHGISKNAIYLMRCRSCVCGAPQPTVLARRSRCGNTPRPRGLENLKTLSTALPARSSAARPCHWTPSDAVRTISSLWPNTKGVKRPLRSAAAPRPSSYLHVHTGAHSHDAPPGVPPRQRRHRWAGEQPRGPPTRPSHHLQRQRRRIGPSRGSDCQQPRRPTRRHADTKRRPTFVGDDCRLGNRGTVEGRHAGYVTNWDVMATGRTFPRPRWTTQGPSGVSRALNLF